MQFIEINTEKEKMTLLNNFYNTLFIQEFPDENERESLDNMFTYLKLKENGWYKKNNYHIILVKINKEIIGGAIVDYFSKPNCGAIEFILVKPEYRIKNIATKLLDYVKEILVLDAKKINKKLNFIFGEVNDPVKTKEADDSMNPSERLKFWYKKNYYILNMFYLQPALSKNTKPVESLLLIANVFNENYLNYGIPKNIILQAIYYYMKLAMRINNPNKHQIFKQIKKKNKMKRILFLK